jgi:Sulfatase-modifying factor enzyme 1/PEGA domain
MPSYGSYETVREISSSVGAAVYTARKSGESGEERFAVKVLTKTSFLGAGGGLFGGETASDESRHLEDFQETIRIQKQAAESSSQIAPVFESGTTGEATWAVSRFYPRTIQKLIQGRVVLNPAALHHIVQSVVRGLLALKRACQRSHGNLKPSNILVGGAARITEAEVALADPTPGDASQAEAFERADLNALGTVIYQLVRRKEIPRSADWLILPLEKSREWTETLGKQADAWLALCNRLLDPNLSLDRSTLEDVAEELARLQPKPPISIRKVAILTAVMLSGVAVAFFVIRATRPGNILLTSDPPGVEVTIRAPETGANPVRTMKTPPDAGRGLKLNLEKGVYELTGAFGDLTPYTNRIIVAEDKVSLEREGDVETHIKGMKEISIRLDYGELSITSSPPGAEIIFDKPLTHGPKPETPYRNPYAPAGTISYQLKLENYKSSTNKTVLLNAGDRVESGATLDRRPPNSIEITFSGLPTIKAPLKLIEIQKRDEGGRKIEPLQNPISLNPGDYAVKVGLGNFTPITTNLVINPGDKDRYVEVRFENTKIRLNAFNILTGDSLEAEVTVAGRDVSENVARDDSRKVTPLVIYWPSGSNVNFQFSSVGFEPTNHPANLEGTDVTINQRLNPLVGTLQVTSDPPGAGVYSATNETRLLGVASNDMNHPLPIRMASGPQAFIARYPGLADVPFSHVFEQGVIQSTNLHFAYGTLQLKVQPDLKALGEIPGQNRDVAIYVDGKPRSSLTLLLPEATYPVVASNGYFGSVPQRVPVLRGQVTNRTFFLGGFLSVKSIPPGAEVYELWSDLKVPRGRAPTNFWTRAGERRFEFRLPKTDDAAASGTNTVAVNVGYGSNHQEVEVNFERPDIFTNSLQMVLVWVEKLNLFVATTEVAQWQYDLIMGETHVNTVAGANLPVTDVSWSDATAFCARLNTALAEIPLRGPRAYRLPTTQEWSVFAGVPNWDAAVTGVERPVEVNQGAPNEFGLYNVRGNVWEWCYRKGERRGASYLSTERKDVLTTFGREDLDPNGSKERGFRVVLADPVPPGQAR